jgi:hypothetical protein
MLGRMTHAAEKLNVEQIKSKTWQDPAARRKSEAGG